MDVIIIISTDTPGLGHRSCRQRGTNYANAMPVSGMPSLRHRRTSRADTGNIVRARRADPVRASLDWDRLLDPLVLLLAGGLAGVRAMAHGGRRRALAAEHASRHDHKSVGVPRVSNPASQTIRLGLARQTHHGWKGREAGSVTEARGGSRTERGGCAERRECSERGAAGGRSEVILQQALVSIDLQVQQTVPKEVSGIGAFMRHVTDDFATEQRNHRGGVHAVGRSERVGVEKPNLKRCRTAGERECDTLTDGSGVLGRGCLSQVAQDQDGRDRRRFAVRVLDAASPPLMVGKLSYWALFRAKVSRAAVN